MKRNQLDVLTTLNLGIMRRDDREVFATGWRHARLLVTHDTDFLDDRRFPVNRCPGLIVLPEFGREMMAFGRLMSAVTYLVHKGREIWFGTKITVTRDYVLTMRTWERAEGYIQTWKARLNVGRGLQLLTPLE
jgi:hypothetical protein